MGAATKEFDCSTGVFGDRHALANRDLSSDRSTGAQFGHWEVALDKEITRKPSLIIPSKALIGTQDEAMSKLTAGEPAELEQLANDKIAFSNWFSRRARVFIQSNPRLVLQRAFRKLEAGFSWRLNPQREPLAQAAYALGYVPVIVLGLAGMILAGRKSEVILIGMLFLAFMGVTALFWAHTSHRSYLDVYLMVFAASVVIRVQTDHHRRAAS